MSLSHVQTLKSTQAMADAMRGATKAMGAMNKQMNLPALTKIMREFERQNEKMEMTSEMMGDAVDDAFEVHLLSALGFPCHLSRVHVPAVKDQCSVWRAFIVLGVTFGPARLSSTACYSPCSMRLLFTHMG